MLEKSVYRCYYVVNIDMFILRCCAWRSDEMYRCLRVALILRFLLWPSDILCGEVHNYTKKNATQRGSLGGMAILFVDLLCCKSYALLTLIDIHRMGNGGGAVQERQE